MNGSDGTRSSSPSDFSSGTLVNRFITEMVHSPDGWLENFTHVVIEFGFDIHEIRSIATDLAWVARCRGEPLSLVAVSEACNDVTPELIMLYVVGQRLRFDFKFSELKHVVEQGIDQNFQDALVTSFLAFAALGEGSPEGVQLLNTALNLPDADRRTRHVCLAGVWSAHDLEGQAHHLLELCDRMLDLGEGDGNVHFRRAAALRKLYRFGEALSEVNQALALLPPGNNDVHQDYLRERELIGLAMSLWRG